MPAVFILREPEKGQVQHDVPNLPQDRLLVRVLQYRRVALRLDRCVCGRELPPRLSSAVRAVCHASTSTIRTCLSAMRRSRHRETKTPGSDSAMSSQLPCCGGWKCHSKRSTRRRASAGAKASYSEAGLCVVGLSCTSTIFSMLWTFVLRIVLAHVDQDQKLLALLGAELHDILLYSDLLANHGSQPSNRTGGSIERLTAKTMERTIAAWRTRGRH